MQTVYLQPYIISRQTAINRRQKLVAYDMLGKELYHYRSSKPYCLCRVYREINQSSFNQTEAASRWTNIANAFNDAEKAALMAQDEAYQALNTAQNNLGQKAKDARRRNFQVHRNIMTRKLAIISKRL